jgi:hypothetical protein
MKARLETNDGKALYRRHKRTIEPVLGIIKSVIGSSVSDSGASTRSLPSGS